MAEPDNESRITEGFLSDGSDPAGPSPVGAARSLHRLNQLLKVLAGTLMFLLMALTFVDVVGRYAFNRPIPSASEVIEMTLALLIFSALPLVTGARGHITVSLFDNFMSRMIKQSRDLSVLIGSAGVIGFISFLMWRSGLDMYESNFVSRTLDFPLATIMFAISVLGAITLVILLAMIWQHVLGAAIPGDPDRAA